MRTALVPSATLPLAACAGRQSALDPHGLQSDQILHIVFIFLIVAAVVWIAVVIVLCVSMLRRKRGADQPLALHAPFEQASGRIVSALGVVTLVIVLGLSIVSYAGQRTVFAKDEHALTLKIIGHQWWWEVRYEDPRPDKSFVTANEIRIPAGQPVKVELESADVIHSFWVPSLTGKMDLITGQKNELQFTAKNAGIYRGQCAEFCGLQHAHMSLFVIAEPPDRFEAWRDAQLGRAADPATDEEKRGQQIVTGKPCGACHSVRGTSAAGMLGPDLTHVASRSYIAAGLLPTTRGSLAAWVADPQTIKPGNNMPLVPLTGDELRAVSAYLASLK
jgi:cytochrome c oxidase subunit 2